jgi:hypothetical protein
MSRLEVNIGEGVAKVLADVMEADGITATEAVRRAFSVYHFVRKQEAEGNAWAIVGPDGTAREVTWWR